ncbi:MAG: methyl-accepting chemotaxis protein [Methylococcaceae bacterium]|nr:methyl-accepting chemotaxis protein [Methylococcaceae bacterium]MDZ4155171.1 methyl-accepting chemotaxis protein [Methylococcales bacterium]MDP2394385.1 methyl-accepting chemotaxis protein [Methylococcaceae bacterium]MDP3021428.1 methyl-accepting chemotaxis protein [Methylococcaceae bacterium]MDP3388598.1 methyl-accepting chemotaxis protein [Methylococcaceae bacterium]
MSVTNTSFTKLSIKMRLFFILTTLVLGFAIFGYATHKAMNTLNVNGPIYQRIVQGKDIIADVLPPPEYILESYTVALQLSVVTTPLEIETLITRFQALKTEYDSRHQYWLGQSLEQELKATLLDKSYQEAKNFYTEADQHFLPAIKAGNRENWLASLQNMRKSYEQHRLGIDEVVSYTSKRNAQDELQAHQTITSYNVALLSIFLISIFLAIGVTLIITHGILNSLRSVRDLANSIAGGDLNSKIDATQRHEIGEIFRSMNALQQQLFDRSAGTQKLIDESTRLKMAMDNISVNVMVADSGRNIIYMNPAVLRMLHSAETDIKKSLPHFDVNKLMGTNIDSFHKNPAHQKGMLANLSGTHKAEINIAGHIFSLTANPITDAEGQRLGTVVEWLDRTAEILVEQEVTSVVSAAVAGDFTHQVSEQNKQGFSLLLAQSINKLLATNATSLADLARVLDALSSGDLTSTIDEDYAGTYGQLKDSTNATVANLRQSISEIKDSITSISMASKEIAAGNNDLSHRTEEQASSLEQTAASMQELTSTVKHNSDNAKHANELAVSATEIAGKGVQVVGQVVDTMESIHESSRKIVDIISVIDGIAFQTNILALNAAVEAARAGEQGRGFAVVAGEVRNLAQRAAAAAGEIKGLIGNSVEQIEDGTRLVTHAGKTMEDIVNSIRGVTVIMSQIASASIQQTSGIEQVNLAIGQMDDVTQQNAALVEQAAAAAESLEEQTQNLNSTVGQFIVDSHGAGQSKIITYPTAKNIATTPTKANAQPQKVASSNQEWEEF